ncbi:mitochondrial ribosomal protein L46 precursor, putative [Plasmodium chabaudi adami]|uniref:Mitochondrial ribosomal protein L46, putative n=1 Tax=Plasmodium chabaudi adami TaxID=5826 RepID=A0A1D3RYI1_PLACE|nr:mitochondrial ribosomal protein L46 precursor, putative [Plasmodium chabaudi adami]
MIKKITRNGILEEVAKKTKCWSLFNNNKYGVLFNHNKYISYDGKIKEKENLDESSEATDTLCNVNSNFDIKNILVHDKYKIQVALCIDRFPLDFIPEKFEKDFDDFRDKWLLRTNNNLEISEEFLHMKYNLSSFHDKKKNENNNEQDYLKKYQNNKGDTNEANTEKEIEHEENDQSEQDNLENLFSIEGMENVLSLKRKLDQEKKNKQSDINNINEKGNDDDKINEYPFRNIKRKPHDFLYLLVKYKKTGNSNDNNIVNKWMFPFIDFKKKLLIRENLQYLCSHHLKCEIPFFIGYSPCTFEKRKFKTPLIPNEIIGRKIFYYRAHYTNNDANINLIENQYIHDFAWVTRSELKQFLSISKYHVIKDSIPLT